MMKPFFAFLLLATLLYACARKPDLIKEEQAIRALLQQERKAHFDRNVELFVSEFTDSILNVNKGKITLSSKEDNRKRIGNYFGKGRFIQWDDVSEPLIRFADDASLAYAVVQKQVILSYPDSLGKTMIDTTGYAWVSMYRKLNGAWKVEANVSTNK